MSDRLEALERTDRPVGVLVEAQNEVFLQEQLRLLRDGANKIERITGERQMPLLWRGALASPRDRGARLDELVSKIGDLSLRERSFRRFHRRIKGVLQVRRAWIDSRLRFFSSGESTKE